MQVGSVSFAAWFFCLCVCFFRIHVIDIWKVLEIRQKSCPTKILLHMIYTLVYLRTKMKQVKNPSQEALKVVNI